MTLTAPPTQTMLGSANGASAATMFADAAGPHRPGEAVTPKIAIVDDEPINIKVVRKYLQGVGYSQFVTTSDSTTAMGLIRAEMPDVVLLDVMMPQVDGIQILRMIRADERLRYVPVLILTASTDSETKSRAGVGGDGLPCQAG